MEEKIIELNNYVMLRNLINDGEYNKGENFLFDNVISEHSTRAKKIAFWFYKKLMNKSDDELVNGNFTRDEIRQGLDDVKKIFNMF